MATKPAPDMTIDLSKEIPHLMAKYTQFCKKSGWDYVFDYKDIVSILDANKITYSPEELKKGVTSALIEGDLEIAWPNNGGILDFGFKLTKNYVTRWTEPGH